MRKATVLALTVFLFSLSCTSRKDPSSAPGSQATANSQPDCKGQQVNGPEQQALVEKIKSMSESEKIATITNYIDTQISQAEPGSYAAALTPNGSKPSTIERTMDSFRQLRVAQMKDFLIETGRKKAEVDELTDDGVLSMFKTAMKEKGCA